MKNKDESEHKQGDRMLKIYMRVCTEDSLARRGQLVLVRSTRNSEQIKRKQQEKKRKNNKYAKGRMGEAD